MIHPVLQIVAVAIVALILGRWRANIGRRNKQTWESLIARLRPDWSGRDLSDHFLWKEGLNATPDETWERLNGARGLWAMYQNAKVIQEMADAVVGSGIIGRPIKNGFEVV